MEEDRSAPAAAAGAGRADDFEAFDEWASRQRRRATLDGAWRVEVTERVVRGSTIRSVTTWHDNVKQAGTPLRRAGERGKGTTGRSRVQQDASAPNPPRQTARKRRSALRSAAHHRKVRLRLLGCMTAVRFLVRMSSLAAAARAMREALLPSKRRHSPPPPDSCCASDGSSAALQPPPKRLEIGWLRRALLRVSSGDG